MLTENSESDGETKSVFTELDETSEDLQQIEGNIYQDRKCGLVYIVLPVCFCSILIGVWQIDESVTDIINKNSIQC